MVNIIDHDRALRRLLAGRIRASEIAGFFSSMLYAMNYHERIDFGTFAVDQRWRLYYDPQKCLEWTIDEIAASWLHEVNHLYREHGKRFDAMGDNSSYARSWNASADAPINSDLKDMNVILPNPEKRYYAEPNSEYPYWKRGMVTEELYKIARSGAGNQNTDSGESSPSQEPTDPSQSDSEGTEEQSESTSENNKESSSQDTTEKNKKEKSESSESDSTDESSSEKNNEDASDEDNSSRSSSKDQKDNSSSEQNDSLSSEKDKEDEHDSDNVRENNENDNGDGEKNTESSEDVSDSEDSILEPDDQERISDCGSGSCGGSRDYEETDENDGSIDDSRAEDIRQQASRDILDYQSRWGTVPGGLVKEAQDILDPQVDWRKEFAAIMRKVSAYLRGKKKYSYTRPSTRRGNSSFIFPSLRSPPPPRIALVLDTSGSMTPADTTACLGEMDGILRSVTKHADISVINCDVKSAKVQSIKNIYDLEIIGGGGTDMRVGIKQVSQLKPTPDIIITMTDGGTPWPTEIPLDALKAIYVVLLVVPQKNAERDRMKVPSWMQTIVIDPAKI